MKKDTEQTYEVIIEFKMRGTVPIKANNKKELIEILKRDINELILPDKKEFVENTIEIKAIHKEDFSDFLMS